MKNFFLFASVVVMLTSCTSSQKEETNTNCDSTKVCVDTCKAAPTSTVVADSTKK